MRGSRKRELLHDVLPDPLGGSGREGGDRHLGKPRAYAMELAILRAEVMTPVRNAMRLVDDQRGNAAGGMHPGQDFAFELGLQQPLGSHVQQLELAALQARQAPRYFGAFERGVDERGFDAVVLEQAYLVLHQRDQRRYHDAYAGAKQGRQLKAQRLAAAGWHDGEQVAAAQDVAHDLLLPGTKGIKAKALLELGGEGGRRQVGGKRVVHPSKHNLVRPRRRKCETLRARHFFKFLVSVELDFVNCALGAISIRGQCGARIPENPAGIASSDPALPLRSAPNTGSAAFLEAECDDVSVLSDLQRQQFAVKGITKLAEMSCHGIIVRRTG